MGGEAHGEEEAAEIPDQTSEQAVLAPGHPWYRQTDKTHNSLSEPRNPCPGRHWSGPRDCIPSLGSDPPAHSVPMSIHRGSLLGAWMPGPAQAMSKQKMARQENLQRTPAHP